MWVHERHVSNNKLHYNFTLYKINNVYIKIMYTCMCGYMHSM